MVYTRRHMRRRRAPRRTFGKTMLLGLVLSPFFLGLLILGGVTIGLQTAAALVRDLPRLDNQKEVVLAQTSRVYAADGSLLAYLYADENRQLISGEAIPRVMKDAIVAIEDERYYQHNGVDYRGIARAVVRDLEAGTIEEGASTITQQLVGNLYLDRTETSITRKLREAALAMQLETKMTKDEILDLYLNTIFFGSNAYGIRAAARTYFDKQPDELTLPEAALLAGLPQAPTAYSPRLNPVPAKNRRDEVLRAMYTNGFVTYLEYQNAVNTPVRLSKSSPYQHVQEPYVVDYVRQQLLDMFGRDVVYKGGLVVQTTINPAYQRIGQQAISTTLDRPGDPSAALVSVDTRTGYIRAMVGSSDYDKSKFNLAAQARRQPGSAFKTFALVAGVELGMDPETTWYDSEPIDIWLPGETKPWSVKTYSHSYLGTVNLEEATLRSDNTVYAQLAMDVGPKQIVDVAHRMGVKSEVSANPAIVLGGLTYGVSPLDMAAAYATLAAEGRHMEPTIILSVTDATGKVLYKAEPKPAQAISAGVAYTVTKILEQNVWRGTGTAAQLPDGRAAAGKTGTAEDWADAWFCGYIPQLSTSVWVGHPNAKIPMLNVHGMRVSGGTFPTQIWYKFNSGVMRDFPAESFKRPDKPMIFEEDLELQYGNTYEYVEPVRSTTTTGKSTTTTTKLGQKPPTTKPPKPTPTTAPPTTSPPPTGTTAPPDPSDE